MKDAYAIFYILSAIYSVPLVITYTYNIYQSKKYPWKRETANISLLLIFIIAAITLYTYFIETMTS